MNDVSTDNGAIVVFARMDSRRTPGKVLADLGGRLMLGRVLDRLHRSSRCRRLIIATSDRPVDDPVATFAATEGVSCFRGAADDVAGRAAACLDRFGLNWMLRISGDSPFIDPNVVDGVIDLFLRDRPDLATNVHPRTFPTGCSAEAVTAAAMRRILHETSDPSMREHVTAWIYAHAGDWRISNLSAADSRFTGTSLVVDTPEELALAVAMVHRLSDPSAASLDELLKMRNEVGGGHVNDPQPRETFGAH